MEFNDINDRKVGYEPAFCLAIYKQGFGCVD